MILVLLSTLVKPASFNCWRYVAASLAATPEYVMLKKMDSFKVKVTLAANCGCGTPAVCALSGHAELVDVEVPVELEPVESEVEELEVDESELDELPDELLLAESGFGLMVIHPAVMTSSATHRAEHMPIMILRLIRASLMSLRLMKSKLLHGRALFVACPCKIVYLTSEADCYTIADHGEKHTVELTCEVNWWEKAQGAVAPALYPVPRRAWALQRVQRCQSRQWESAAWHRVYPAWACRHRAWGAEERSAALRL